MRDINIFLGLNKFFLKFHLKSLWIRSVGFLGAERHKTILKLLGPIELNNGLELYSLFDKTFLFEYSCHNLANILKKITYVLE